MSPASLRSARWLAALVLCFVAATVPGVAVAGAPSGTKDVDGGDVGALGGDSSSGGDCVEITDKCDDSSEPSEEECAPAEEDENGVCPTGSSSGSTGDGEDREDAGGVTAGGDVGGVGSTGGTVASDDVASSSEAPVAVGRGTAQRVTLARTGVEAWAVALLGGCLIAQGVALMRPPRSAT
jgi:hypothetical protein